MKTLLGIFFLVAVTVSAQEKHFCWEKDLPEDTTKNYYGIVSVKFGGHIVQTTRNDKVYFTYDFSAELIVDLWQSYQKECRDTIRAKMYEGEFLVQREGYTEMMTAKQLEDSGYKYKYRWITNTTQPFEFEYVFIYEPTISGFMEYLSKKLAREK